MQELTSCIFEFKECTKILAHARSFIMKWIVPIITIIVVLILSSFVLEWVY